jgi:hypothetical protein
MQDDFLNFGTYDFASGALAPAGAVVFPNQIDLEDLRDIGVGIPLLVEVKVRTNVTVAANYHIVRFALGTVASLAGGFLSQVGTGYADVLASGGEYAAYNSTGIPGGGFNAGLLGAATALKPTYSFWIPPLDRLEPGQRYLGLAIYSVLGTSNITAGTLSAAIVLNPQADRRYAGGFVVS